ncbi:hypothetical protein KC19_1G213200 [Ceratodon purpureus]|uniref:Bifunctional inhibitor/plant lipid transfer protein/seed storage helical domain-containing protein n=1 Tax=Ceratodon purpureus TaxID=3225 RepID=A0A8T0JAR8_CERPU|nr:hypothetical protein KC19_1G213200 [Ceratodon purpureus]
MCVQVGAAVTMTVEAGVIERCNGAVVELVPCEDSINGKNAIPVTHGCCMALSELLLSPECLCYAATTAPQGFDMKQILGLPAACKYHVKSHQTCEGIPIPSYSKPPSEDLALSDLEDVPPEGFSDEIREEIKKEFLAHQARMDSLKPIA